LKDKGKAQKGAASFRKFTDSRNYSKTSPLLHPKRGGGKPIFTHCSKKSQTRGSRFEPFERLERFELFLWPATPL
jgi:hypothetical protein